MASNTCCKSFAGKGNVPTTIRNDPTIHPDFNQYYETLREASCGALPNGILSGKKHFIEDTYEEDNIG